MTIKRQAKPRHLPLFVMLAAICLFGGAGCPKVVEQYTVTSTRKLPEAPSIEQIITAINENTDRVDSLYAPSALISGPMLASLHAVVAYERPMRFRLRGKTALLGPEIDLGSNDEQFWFWVRRSEPPALYFCRHSEFQNSPASQSLMIEPRWLIEALGIVHLDPAAENFGPYKQDGERWEVRSIVPVAGGRGMRATIVDAAHGWIVEQRLYDASGTLVASARAGAHRRDPLSNATLPQKVEIDWPATRSTLVIELRDMQINQLPQEAEQYWIKPDMSDVQSINLADSAALQQAREQALQGTTSRLIRRRGGMTRVDAARQSAFGRQ